MLTAGQRRTVIGGGAVFLLIGALPVAMFAARLVSYVRMGSWELVPVTVTQLDLRTQGSDKGSMDYQLKAEYAYTYHGQDHTGSRVSLDYHGSGSERNCERHAILAGHRRNRQPFLAWVNPKAPEESVLFRELTGLWTLLGFGGLFMALGALTMAVPGMVSRLDARRAEARKNRPLRPWRANPYWAKGFDFDVPPGGRIIGAAIACILCLFLAVVIFWAIAQKDWPFWAPIAGGIFGLFGVMAGVSAVYWSFQAAKYGTPRLAMAEMPAVPGRMLRAIVLCRRHVDAAGAFKVTLKCTRTTGSGEDSKSETLYEKSVEVAKDLATERGGTAIPVEMLIPEDLPATTAPLEDPSIRWKLSVQAATPGVNFQAEFGLPVFSVGDESLIEKRPESSGG